MVSSVRQGGQKKRPRGYSSKQLLHSGRKCMDYSSIDESPKHSLHFHPQRQVETLKLNTFPTMLRQLSLRVWPPCGKRRCWRVYHGWRYEKSDARAQIVKIPAVHSDPTQTKKTKKRNSSSAHKAGVDVPQTTYFTRSTMRAEDGPC